MFTFLQLSLIVINHTEIYIWNYIMYIVLWPALTVFQIEVSRENVNTKFSETITFSFNHINKSIVYYTNSIHCTLLCGSIDSMNLKYIDTSSERVKRH